MEAWVSGAATWLATLATLFLLLRLLSHQLYGGRRLNLPPGLKPWPIIENLNLIGPLPHRSLHTLSQKHGTIVHLWFGSVPIVVGSSIQMAEAFLKTQDTTFASRPKMASGKYTLYDSSDILWSPYGPYWRQARKMCQMELFSAERLESYLYIRREEINNLMKELYQSAKKPILLKTPLSALSLNIISRMVLGKYYTKKSGGGDNIVTPEEFRKMLDEMFLLNGVLNIGDYIPWVNFLDLQGYIKRMKALGKKFDWFLEHVLDEHNERRKGVRDHVPKDMVDVLLKVAEDPNLEVKLDRVSVKALTVDLIAGGTEGAAVTIEWALSELLKNPITLKKATEELDRVIGRERWVEEKDITHLPYIEAIAKETMRLHPVAPMLVPRIALKDCNIAGYDIPKDTRFLVNIWTIGRDPTIWDNPNEFNPTRFIGSGIDVKGHNFKLLPFGAGRRMCLGYSLGLKVVESGLANLLHGFN